MDGTTRVALVTGADGGLGQAIVHRLGGVGWSIAASTRAGGTFAADVSDSKACDRLVAAVLARFGRLDLLVNNAAYMTLASITSHPVDDWWRVIEVNLSGAFFLARGAAPALREAQGHIVNIASRMGMAGDPDGTAYSASKAGLIGLTKALAHELAPEVRVNALAPGPIDTPQLLVDAQHNRRSLEDERQAAVKRSPLRRLATPDEIAGSVVFLVSKDASHYTGQVLCPNGGLLM
ncbi:MAG: SDR family oxidoreductase [Candidatus Dormibacteraeota bacterium]|nr:SDR family oxidoreductase [Candidatus Dormibacteraeota bacterium]